MNATENKEYNAGKAKILSERVYMRSFLRQWHIPKKVYLMGSIKYNKMRSEGRVDDSIEGIVPDKELVIAIYKQLAENARKFGYESIAKGYMSKAKSNTAYL
jgi:hypothetical protein